VGGHARRKALDERNEREAEVQPANRPISNQDLNRAHLVPADNQQFLT
jgi:hypothetical protein